MALPLDKYMEVLRTVTPAEQPFDLPAHEAAGTAFVNLAHSLASFIEEARKPDSIGYAEALDKVRQMVGYLPANEVPSAADLLHFMTIARRSA